ncbi:MAG: MFS transporter [Candidatus Bathyarchaeota archaeon]|nr:MFS transporter [Candidatus Bathyarchaeota archaeon]
MRAWYFALFPRKIAAILFSNLLPLYVAYSLGRGAVDVAIVAASTGLTHIPGSFIWGYLADKTRKCRFITVSSIVMYSTFMILFTGAKTLFDLVFLSMLVGFFGSAIPPIEDILMAEGSSRDEWGEEARSYGIISEIGDLAGLAIGALLLSLYEHTSLIYLCGYLALSSSIASLILIEDPIFMVERKIVHLERSVSNVEKLSMILEYQDLYGGYVSGYTHLKIAIDPSRSMAFFVAGVLAFTMATDMVFTFITMYLCGVLGVPQSVAFIILLLNEVGSILGYIVFRGVCRAYRSHEGLKNSAIIRAFLVFTFIPCSYLPHIAASILDTIILIAIGVFYTLFALSSRIVRMEILPEGWMGLYACVTKIGSITSMVIGGLIIAQYSFNHLFMVAGILFLASYTLFNFI